MTPVEQAAAVYLSEPCARTFREDLESHLLHGVVFSTPTAFIMARYVARDWPPHRIVDPSQNNTTDDHLDCLHVYLASGDLTEFFTFPHKPCKWVSFERENVLKFYSYERIHNLIRRQDGAAKVPAAAEGQAADTNRRSSTGPRVQPPSRCRWRRRT